jgi:hypothetical protein
MYTIFIGRSIEIDRNGYLSVIQYTKLKKIGMERYKKPLPKERF